MNTTIVHESFQKPFKTKTLLVWTPMDVMQPVEMKQNENERSC